MRSRGATVGVVTRAGVNQSRSVTAAQLTKAARVAEMDAEGLVFHDVRPERRLERICSRALQGHG